ncbi:mCG147121 [Mus musculus]|nr:mCG147121 [Mus musculus]
MHEALNEIPNMVMASSRVRCHIPVISFWRRSKQS